MGYRISSIDLFVREICPPRMDFAIGKGQSLFPEWMRVNVEVRLQIESDDGRTATGCSADWPSFGWLDKRPDLDPRQKLRELLMLLMSARDSFLANADFKTPFECWWSSHKEFHERDQNHNSVPLCGSFCIALIERALIDAFCRIENSTFHRALRLGRTGIRAERIHPELKGFDFASNLPPDPRDHIFIRHTVGANDPVVATDVANGGGLNDGLPHVLKDYLKTDGISHFKIKICGNATSDRRRLNDIWTVIQDSSPMITLDGNESYDNIDEFSAFVEALEKDTPQLFQHIRFIEQPMNRAMTMNDELQPVIEKIARLKPLIIDEADGYLHAFYDAVKIGYQGVSHKNCKGIFKSLANFALCCERNRAGSQLFLSAEDLTSMPLVSLHQDFAVIAALGLKDAERNGHHFFYGLAHLTDKERSQVAENYPELYRDSGNDWFLNVREGQVDISSLNLISGLGVAVEPDWSEMTKLEDWLSDFNSESRAH